MRISDWGSDVCSSDLTIARIEFQIVQQFEREITEDGFAAVLEQVVGNLSKWVTVRIACSIEGVDGKGIRSRRFQVEIERAHKPVQPVLKQRAADLKFFGDLAIIARSEEHTSELKSLMRISYAVFCLQKK